MFWQCNNNSSTEIDSLLCKEDVTLYEVMDSDDVISQCKAQNKSLVDYLIKPEMISELVNLISKEPSIDLDEKTRFKYPHIACELLTCDVPAINERLASNTQLLDTLCDFLESEPPLNPLLASYFSRVLSALISRNTQQNWLSYRFTCLQILDYLKAKDTFISLLLKHLGTSAIMDLMLTLMTQMDNEADMRENTFKWLDKQGLLLSLVSLLNSKYESEKHYNVAQLLCDFIKTARDTRWYSSRPFDHLLDSLESSETVSLLLENMFEGEKSESGIVGGIQVLLTLLEKVDYKRMDEVIESTTDAMLPHLKHFHNLLLEPPKKSSLKTTIGVMEIPLGNTRLQVSRLFAVAIACNNEKLNEEIITLDTFSVLIDLFFKYPWNNFLHTQVENCLISAFEIYALSRHLLVKCNVIERILKACKDNDEQEKESKSLRQGYMGHLINIINKIIELCSDSALGKFLIDNLPDVAKDLEEYKDGDLKEVNKLQNTVLGGSYPKSSSDDYGNMTFAPDQFSSYQAQHLIPFPLDSYSGFSDDAFNDVDDTLQSFDHREGLLFNVTPSDVAQQIECFKQVCIQNINTLDDLDDQAFEDRDNTFQTVIEKEDQNETVYSSDSDDELQSGASMEIENSSAVSTDPWGSSTEQKSINLEVGDWADFNSATFEANFDNAFVVEKEIVSIVINELDNESNEEEAKNEKTVSIENVAQNVEKKNESDEKAKEKEGGDLCVQEKDNKTGSAVEEVAEPSIPSSLVEGESCLSKSPETTSSDNKDV